MKKVKNILLLSILNIVLISMTRVNATTEFKVGDYVEMTPSSTSFEIPASLTGYESDQTINPSELNLWRVIRINDDKTVEMVSEYVSSTNVYFKGKTGYQNYVGVLNTIAKQYENPNYTTGSRHMGYNGQTEYITDTTKIDQTTPPWSASTTDNTNEALGGGDILYQTDEDLVTKAIGSLKANKAGTTTATFYWLASRYYGYQNTSNWLFCGRAVKTSGSMGNYYLYYYLMNSFKSYNNINAIRPIVTLKSGIKATSGDGQSVNSPWKLDIASTNEEEIKDSNNTNDTNNNENSNNNLNNDNANNDENSNNNLNSDNSNNSNTNDTNDASSSEQKPENKDEINNPQTGVTISILVLGILGIVATAIIYLVKKKSLFRKI